MSFKFKSVCIFLKCLTKNVLQNYYISVLIIIYFLITACPKEDFPRGVQQPSQCPATCVARLVEGLGLIEAEDTPSHQCIKDGRIESAKLLVESGHQLTLPCPHPLKMKEACDFNSLHCFLHICIQHCQMALDFTRQ